MLFMLPKNHNLLICQFKKQQHGQLMKQNKWGLIIWQLKLWLYIVMFMREYKCKELQS